MNQNIYLSGKYARQNPDYHVEDSSWKAQQIAKMLEKHQLQISSVCEIGCGAGEILRQLQQYMPPDTDFYGYEISPQAYALCQPRQNERLHYFCQDLLSSDIQPFDLLLCIDVIEHVEDYMGFLKRLKAHAAYKLFHIPLDLSVQTVMRSTPLVGGRAKVGHLHYFMKETALLTLQDTGYKIIDWCYTPASIDRPKNLKQKLGKIPRAISFRIHANLAVRILGGYSLLVLAK